MRKNRRIFWILVAVLLSGIAVSILSADKKKEPHKITSPQEKEWENQQEIENDEIVAYAEEFTQDDKNGITVLKKNVKIFRQDGFMYADQVTLYQDVNSSSREIIKTVAEGNVHLKDKDILSDCDHAVFDEIDDTIELTGSVVVIQNKDRIEASYIKYNRKTGQRIGKGSPDNPVKFCVKIKVKKKETTKEETKANESKSEEE